MSSQPYQDYNCDSCSQAISPVNPRIRCLVCRDYDLCANCGLSERFTHGHLEGHQTQIFKRSGGSGHPPLIATSSVNYAAPPQSLVNVQNTRSTFQDQEQFQRVPSTPQNPHNYVTTGPEGWQPFFLPDMTPSPTYVTLMNEIFTYLDPMNNGNLEPETFSRFLDDMGYLAHENAWRTGLQANAFGISKESNADKVLKSTYDLFSIDHVLLQRIRPVIQSSSAGAGLASQFSRALRNAVSMQASHQGPMPAITRKGFLDIVTFELLEDPSKSWGNLSRCLKRYNLPKYAAWGDLPRSVLPALPDPATLQKIAGIKQYAQSKAESEIEAARVNAMLRAKGNQAAVDILSGNRTEYIYRY